jgi:hypothetical protein
MKNSTPLTKEELQDVKTWLEKNEKSLPEGVGKLIRRLLLVYFGFTEGTARAKKTLTLLRQAMGFVPKSERGVAEQISFENLSPEKKAEIEKLKKKRDELSKEKAGYNQKLRRLTPKPKVPEQLELAPAKELMFSTGSGSRADEGSRETVERMSEFGKEQGLHSTFDKTKRVDLKILVTETTHEVETVTDPSTGKSVRASMKHVGPEGSQLTWGAIANLVKLHVGFAIPMSRLEMIIGQPEFTSGKICRTLRWVAVQLLPIYLCLLESLSEADIISGDDTGTKVLELNDIPDSEDSLASQIDSHLGWASPRADGNGDKKGLNVSLLIGKTKEDPRSTIRFYRTHLGSVGNLMTKVLEWRLPKAGPLIFQGDLSTTNLPVEELRTRFRMQIAGCAAHARRPFFRHKDDDEDLCYFMLRGFLILSEIEKHIDARGRTEEVVLRWRNRYGRKVWEALRSRCIAATTGNIPGRFTYRKGTFPNLWPKGYDLNRASKYVIKHYDELTLYLSNPKLQYTNNISERALRVEKCMLSSSKFRKNRNGRATLDILRTLNSTCTAADLEIADYLRYVFKHITEIKDHPEAFTPYAVALKLQN